MACIVVLIELTDGGICLHFLEQALASCQGIMIVLYIGPVDLLCRVDAVDVFLDVGVAVTVAVFHGIGRVVRVQSVLDFPGIGHTVVVAVDHGRTFIFRQTADLARMGDDAQLVGVGRQTTFDVGTCELLGIGCIDGLAGLHALHDTGVDGIALGEGSSHVGEYEVIRLLGWHNGHVGHGERLVHAHLGDAFRRHGTIAYLYASCPVVLGDLLVAPHDVAAHVGFAEGVLGFRGTSGVQLHDAVADGLAFGSDGTRLEVVVDETRVFIPASLVSDSYEKDLSKYKDQEIQFVISEFNPKRRRIIGDRKQLLVEKKLEQQKELFAKIKVGDVMEGTVKNVTDFGAFIDLGGADGLLHISEMSWGRVESPKKVFNVGDHVRVFIKDINDTKIALSMKFPSENPWNGAAEKFAVGNIVKGKVARMTDFGAFVELAPGVDALLHVSQISKDHVEKPADVLKIGQEIEAKVVDFNEDDKKISLSIKALEAPEEDAVEAAEVHTEE